jgi:hypothetical protein
MSSPNHLVRGCNNNLQEVLNILDGLCTYWENVPHPITWLFTSKKHILLQFDIPTYKILLIASKIITNNKEDDHNLHLINSINLEFPQNLEPKCITLITERHLILLTASCKQPLYYYGKLSRNGVKQNYLTLQLLQHQQ